MDPETMEPVEVTEEVLADLDDIVIGAQWDIKTKETLRQEMYDLLSQVGY